MNEPKLIIHIGVQGKTYVFRLSPHSYLWLEENYPGQRPVDSMVVNYDKYQESRHIPELVWEHALQLLTGFSVEEANQLGGFAVIHPVTHQEFYNSNLVHA